MRPPGEPGEEVGLDEALSHQQVGLRRQLVDKQFPAGGQGAQVDHVLFFTALMDDEAQPGVAVKRLAVFVQQLGLGGGPVEAGGHQYGDLRVGISRPEFLHQLGQDHLAGYRAGVVAAEDDHFVLARRQLPQAGGADGVFQGLTHQLRLVRLGLIAVGPGLEHPARRPSGMSAVMCPRPKGSLSCAICRSSFRCAGHRTKAASGWASSAMRPNTTTNRI